MFTQSGRILIAETQSFPFSLKGENRMNANTFSRQSKTSFTTKQMVTISLLSALAYVLMLFHLPYKHLGFLEFEFSDIPAVIAALQFGPFAGIIVELIKNLINALTASTTGGVGELANFLISSSYMLTVGILYKLRKSRLSGAQKKETTSGIVQSKYYLIFIFSIATIAMALIGAILNYYVMLPLYARLFFSNDMQAIVGMAAGFVPSIKDLGGLILIGITPYNIAKGIAISIIGYYTHRLLKGRILS